MFNNRITYIVVGIDGQSEFPVSLIDFYAARAFDIVSAKHFETEAEAVSAVEALTILSELNNDEAIFYVKKYEIQFTDIGAPVVPEEE